MRLTLFRAFAATFIDLTSRTSHGPGLVWADERSSATGFIRLFVLCYATLSGANYADIAPATGFARDTASLVEISGQIFLAVVAARLVGLHVTPPGCRNRSLIICGGYRVAHPEALPDIPLKRLDGHTHELTLTPNTETR